METVCQAITHTDAMENLIPVTVNNHLLNCSFLTTMLDARVQTFFGPQDFQNSLIIPFTSILEVKLAKLYETATDHISTLEQLLSKLSTKTKMDEYIHSLGKFAVLIDCAINSVVPTNYPTPFPSSSPPMNT